MLSSIVCAIATVLLFSAAIFIHEFGHFLAARSLGFKVEAFSIGFGPALFKWKRGGVEYRIAAIPFGGYVSLPQLDPAGMEKIQGKHGEDADSRENLPDAPPWKRILVAAAGPAGNVILAVAIAVGLSLVPSARFGELGTEIGGVVEGGPADGCGVVIGERVVAVNSHPVSSWFEMQTEVQIAGENPARLTFLAADGSTHDIEVVPRRDPVSGATFVGLLSTPNPVKAAAWMPARDPLAQLKWDSMSIVRVLKALVTPSESKAVASSLGGPVLIVTSLYQQVKDNVWDAFGFLRFICINLALFNLLPLPVLDGGHCLFALFEIVTGRKMRRKAVEGATNIFMVLLVALLVWLVYRDSARLVRVHRAEAASGARVEEPAENPER